MPYVLGGMQKHSYYLAKYFAQNKIYVDLFHFNNSIYDIDTLDVFTPDEKKYINATVLKFPKSIRFPGHYIFQSYKYSVLLFEAIEKKLSTYDFIYTKGFTGWKLLQEKNNSKIKCCPVGINFHGYEMFQIAPEFKAKILQYLLKPFVKKINLQADVVFSYGNHITKIIKELGVAPAKIIESLSAIEIDFLVPSISEKKNENIKFVFIGRSERRKGITELNSAIIKLLAERKKFSFEFIGPISDEEKINHDCITYHGEIREASKIKELLINCDVLVCPSWSEGFPNVILEAMACGLAIIATDVGAVGAIINEKNGWLIPPLNAKALLNALNDAIKTSQLNIKKTNALHVMKTQYNWTVIAKQLITQIQNFTKKNN